MIDGHCRRAAVPPCRRAAVPPRHAAVHAMFVIQSHRRTAKELKMRHSG